MEVILLERVENLGIMGDVVKVKPGYARNFLFSHGLAVRSSKRNRALVGEKKAAIKAKANREAKVFEDLLSQLKKTEITIEVQVGEEDKMFGSITTLDIHKSLESKGVAIDRHDILLDEPIRALGIYHVPVRVAPDVTGDIKIYVIKS